MIENFIKEVKTTVSNIEPSFFNNMKVDKSHDLNEPISMKNPFSEKDLKESTYSEDIMKCMFCKEEYETYKSLDLKETIVNDRVCLIKDIDKNYVDKKTGLTNAERMERGLSPIDSKTGDKIELHHMGQKFNAPLVELTSTEHRQNMTKLHTSFSDSWRNDINLKNQYNNSDKPNHWKDRVNI